MEFLKISDNSKVRVAVPSKLILPETDANGATVEKTYLYTDKEALQRWAFIQGLFLLGGKSNGPNT